MKFIYLLIVIILFVILLTSCVPPYQLPNDRITDRTDYAQKQEADEQELASLKNDLAVKDSEIKVLSAAVHDLQKKSEAMPEMSPTIITPTTEDSHFPVENNQEP